MATITNGTEHLAGSFTPTAHQDERECRGRTGDSKLNQTSDNACPGNPTEFLAEIGCYKVVPPARVTLALAIEHQVTPRRDVLVVLNSVLSPHPHELLAPETDPVF